MVACADVGKAINKNSCEGQIEGGPVYNLSFVTENIAYENGYTKAHSLPSIDTYRF